MWINATEPTVLEVAMRLPSAIVAGLIGPVQTYVDKRRCLAGDGTF
jgi:hypothetical protein